MFCVLEFMRENWNKESAVYMLFFAFIVLTIHIILTNTLWKQDNQFLTLKEN